MAKSQRTIQKQLRQLRTECIDSDDRQLSRLAYAMECAVRWATEDGIVGWSGLVTQAKADADLLKKGL